MPQLLTLSRAARLVGVTRGALQMRIQAGELATFEGMVRAEDLQRLYPDVRLEDDSQIERMAHIADSAFTKRLSERLLPETGVLVARITRLGQELAQAKAELAQHQALVERLGAELAAIEQSGGEEARRTAIALKSWLRDAREGGGRNMDYPSSLMVKDSFLRVMAAQVRILPSGNEFFVEGSDTLLDAALHAGLALNYGCSNGNCGLCKARIVSGEVKRLRHHDYTLSEAEKAQGYVLLCSYTPVTDLEIETAEAAGAHDIPVQEIAARVTGIERPTEDMAILKLQTPRTQRLRFLAGQYATLEVGHAWQADLPIASCPCDDRNLQFHIPRTPNSPFSEHVFTRLRSGDTVSLEGPRGEFLLREDSPRSLIFIAYGTGFAPVKSLIEHAMALDVAETIDLYWLVSRQDGHYLQNQCRAWADALDNFRCAPLVVPVDTPEDAARAYAEAMARISDEHPRLADFDVYVAGSEGLVAAAGRVLPERGLPRGQLYVGYIV